MRDIKFRIFDKSINKFHYWGFNVNNIKGFASCPTSKYLHLDNAEELSEQYTGLKDKNGIEVYEGDNLQFYDFKGNKYHHGTVKYLGSAFGSRWDNDIKKCFNTLSGWAIPFEIIGNIHEVKL